MVQSNFGGIRNCLFINAQSKQTVPMLLAPLRRLGIAAAGILDIDAVKEGGAVFSRLMRSAGIPEGLQESIGIQRRRVYERLAFSGKNMKTEGGINLLSGDDLLSAKEFFQTMARYGILFVPCGELESWLSELGITGHGPDWLIKVFEAMGEEPSAYGYAAPTEGDVWDFVREVGSWLQNPMRGGMNKTSQ
ncbi:hypothetical protein LL972_21510 [Xanthomonas campestris pv. asclepiadis]|uniref:hypothetical protein n=1 Tax=Xanthomonas campestris TaxID=339 RepID=UPI001E2DD7C0|nr:hypothetical protein [Xanthomonas campestris]MCC4618523.1 hypothetical protein [Xanthomonas campestris pv. asclepiadis]